MVGMESMHWLSQPKVTKVLMDLVSLTGLLAYALLPVTPPPTGFWCDDMTIRQPRMPSSLNTNQCYVWGYLIPIILMIVVETASFLSRCRRSQSRMLKYEWLWITWNEVLIFLFGIIATQTTTNVAKGTFAKHRPNFFAICRPFNYTCDVTLNYALTYSCHNQDPEQVADVRASFFSGHSSFSFFVAVYTILYLQHKVRWQAVTLYVPLIQLAFACTAAYIAMTRVADHRHHAVDAFFGAAVGTVIAILLSHGHRRRVLTAITSPASL